MEAVEIPSELSSRGCILDFFSPVSFEILGL
jgi:hypothetical protein